MPYRHLPPINPSRLSIHPSIDPKTAQIIGVDEVGRGCLYGQMTVCACVLPVNLSCAFVDLPHTPDLIKLNDSKKLSGAKREKLAQQLHDIASYVLIDVSAEWIDQLNIHQATLYGMSSAISAMLRFYPHATSLIDGCYKPSHTDAATLIKGDAHHMSIAAASILAKVHRDQAMNDEAKLYPAYGFQKHKGYPTHAHKQALKHFGALPKHRKSYAPVAQLNLQNYPND